MLNLGLWQTEFSVTAALPALERSVREHLLPLDGPIETVPTPLKTPLCLCQSSYSHDAKGLRRLPQSSLRAMRYRCSCSCASRWSSCCRGG